MNCPKCNKEMIEGYELMPTKIGYLPKIWVKEMSKKSLFGIEMSNVDPKKAIEVKTFRCPDCGSLVDVAK